MLRWLGSRSILLTWSRVGETRLVIRGFLIIVGIVQIWMILPSCILQVRIRFTRGSLCLKSSYNIGLFIFILLKSRTLVNGMSHCEEYATSFNLSKSQFFNKSNMITYLFFVVGVSTYLIYLALLITMSEKNVDNW